MNIYKLTINEMNQVTQIVEFPGKWLLFPMYVTEENKDIFIRNIKENNLIRMSVYRFLNIGNVTFNDNSALGFTNEYFLKLLHKMIIQYIQYIDMEREIRVEIVYEEQSIPLYKSKIITNTSLDLLSVGKLVFQNTVDKSFVDDNFIKPADHVFFSI